MKTATIFSEVTRRKSTNLSFYHGLEFFFDAPDEMFQLTSAIDLGCLK